MPWEVKFADEFRPEFETFHEDVQDELLALAELLRQLGPQMGRPRVDTLNGSRYNNLKELRFSAADGEWRVVFAFDPKRDAILLIGGDKSGGSEKRFYRELIRKAEQRLDAHLGKLKKLRMKKEGIPMPTNVKDIVAALSPKRQKKIEARVAELMAEEMTLMELRRARKLTQVTVAKKLGVTQDSISRLEKRSDMLISTLRKTVQAMGGDLSIVAQFPNSAPVVLNGIADDAEPAASRPIVSQGPAGAPYWILNNGSRSPFAVGDEVRVPSAIPGIPFHWGLVYAVGPTYPNGVKLIHCNKKSGVETISWADFAGNERLQLTRRARSPQHALIIKGRAIEAKDRNIDYHMLFANCEQFTEYCYSGNHNTGPTLANYLAIAGAIAAIVVTDHLTRPSRSLRRRG